MNPAQLRNNIEAHGGVIALLQDGYRDEDIDDEDLSEMWYEIQVQYDNMVGNIAELEDFLQGKLNEEVD